MRLGELLSEAEISIDDTMLAPEDRTTEIAAVVHDSRAVAMGDVFCCLRGQNSDGHRFGSQAVADGAAALLVDTRSDLNALNALGVPLLVVANTRPAMAALAMARAGHPSRKLRVVGITGTNGKTTTAALLAAILETADVPVEVIGTLTGARTTPESTDLAPQLADIAARGGDIVVMEVSSHALDQHRVDAMTFSLALFTNLTQDHLDFHPTMEEYFRAKAKLFEAGRAQHALVIADGPYGTLLVDSAQIPTTALHPDQVDVRSVRPDGVSFVWRDEMVDLPLGGLFNVANGLLAAEAASKLGIDDATIAAGLRGAPVVPGRFTSVPNTLGISIIVDYAHTPDGLENVLTSARQLVASQEANPGRVIVVFGCGGDRDRAKRPLMGSLAEALADDIIVTSDNPRSEPPDEIIAEILTGMQTQPYIEPDRRAAISRALTTANVGDIVVVAGKGHETTQTIGDLVLPFDDALVSAELAALLAVDAPGSHS